ncbi:U-box domain-containing protein 4 [Typha latifolia]|uniref:U-box domain-containing protein 4 n=1 Tax=Typha latifolia TaxID=4733 RepID=UPI003C2EE0B1
MSLSLDFLSYRRRRSPVGGAYFAPADLSGAALVQTLSAAAGRLVASRPSTSFPFQERNSRSLIRKVWVLSSLFDFLIESHPSPRHFPDSVTLCFRELYILLYRAKMLLDYIAQSGRLWLLLRNPQISGNFHDLDQELATLLDVLPLDGLRLSDDVREHLELLRRQCRTSKLYVDPRDEELRRKVFSFLDDFARGKAPDPAEFQSSFVDQLGISDARSFRIEIEFLEEQIFNMEEEADLPLLGGVVALARYCRFLLLGCQEVEVDFGAATQSSSSSSSSSSGEQFKKSKKRLVSWSGDSSFAIPTDFCCPISLDLMREPVIVSTGQTYDRASIVQWMEEGHYTCPNSGQSLSHNRLVPNRALRNLISQWCAACGIPYDTPESSDGAAENSAAASTSKAAIEANKATAEILVQQLSNSLDDAKTVAARELRLLAKTGKKNRAFIAELGAIPLLCNLLTSSNSVAQENAVTALLNLSIFETNKSRIMEEERSLTLIVDVLRHGWTVDARENAAATLFSLSVVHDYKKMIMSEPGAVAALVNMLTKGTPRGKKDAVMALFNLSTHPESWAGMLETGAVTALAGALGNEAVAEEAAGALALLMKHPTIAHTVGSGDGTVSSLVGLLRRGSPKGKENAVAALQEMCRRCGPTLIRKVARVPALGGLIQNILFTGTKRARRKAALLAKMCQRCDMSAAIVIGNGWAIDHTLVRNSSMRRVSSFGRGDLSVSVPMAISVPVP